MKTNEVVFGEAPPLLPADEKLVECYTKIGRTLDDLFYTEDFERLMHMLKQDGDNRDRREIAHRLLNLRKAGRLPRLGRSLTPPVAVRPEHEETLYSMVEGELRGVGMRDRLVYTPTFDAIVRNFNKATGLQLSPHLVWRLIAKLSK